MTSPAPGPARSPATSPAKDSATRSSVQSFFERYATLSLGGDPEPLAELYAPTFIIGAPQGSQAFPNDEEFLEWLRQVHAFNQKHGMDALEVLAVREMALSPIHRLATVTWRARFAKTGNRPIEFNISYLVEQAKETDWKILSYISERDQEQEMKDQGLL